MKTLEEYNQEKLDWYWKNSRTDPRHNNIACPLCGEELYDSEPEVVITTWPPKKSVHCGNCKYEGNRIA